MPETKLKPIISFQNPGFGVLKDDLVQLGAKAGDWLGATYGNKTVKAQVREVDKNPSWPDNPHLIWIEASAAKTFGLYNEINGNLPTNPPQEKYALAVRRYWFTQSKTLLPAVITFILATVYAFLSAFVQGGIFPEYKMAFGVGILVLAIISALASAITVYTQKQ
jgi:hypothetical protein